MKPRRETKQSLRAQIVKFNAGKTGLDRLYVPPSASLIDLKTAVDPLTRRTLREKDHDSGWRYDHPPTPTGPAQPLPRHDRPASYRVINVDPRIDSFVGLYRAVFLTEDFVQLLALESNRYAAEKKLKFLRGEREITPTDIELLIVFHYAVALQTLNNIRNVWRDDRDTLRPRDILSRNLFQFLNGAFHAVNNSTGPGAGSSRQNRGSRGYDQFWKCRPFLTQVESMQHFWQRGEFISLDETMIAMHTRDFAIRGWHERCMRGVCEALTLIGRIHGGQAASLRRSRDCCR